MVGIADMLDDLRAESDDLDAIVAGLSDAVGPPRLPLPAGRSPIRSPT
jgi:hypothetical protein